MRVCRRKLISYPNKTNTNVAFLIDQNSGFFNRLMGSTKPGFQSISLSDFRVDNSSHRTASSTIESLRTDSRPNETKSLSARVFTGAP
jgi:hypothetical protein